MSSEHQPAFSIIGGNNSQNQQQPPKPQDQKPKKPLPTDRIPLSTQLDILRAYGAISTPDGKPIRLKELGAVVKRDPDTVSLCNPFFSDLKLIIKDGGGYLPSAEVVNYHNAYQWNPETAARELAPMISESWFAQELMSKLNFRPLEESEAIADLAKAVSAGPKYKKSLRLLLEYMEVAGLVTRDGHMLVKASQTPVAQVRSERPIEQPMARSAEPPAPEPQPQQREAQSARSSVTTSFSQPTEGTVQFHISVKVSMSEFATWQADRIQAFFGGIAQVLAAKGTVEKEASKG
jgi:hypothetical protein